MIDLIDRVEEAIFDAPGSMKDEAEAAVREVLAAMLGWDLATEDGKAFVKAFAHAHGLARVLEPPSAERPHP